MYRYENGGGAFLIPYLIVLFLIGKQLKINHNICLTFTINFLPGKPMYYLEMFLGQFTSRSSIKVYNFCPIIKGMMVHIDASLHRKHFKCHFYIYRNWSWSNSVNYLCYHLLYITHCIDVILFDSFVCQRSAMVNLFNGLGVRLC